MIQLQKNVKMMNKTDFKVIITNHKNWMERITQIGDALNIYNIYECDWVESHYNLFDEIIEMFFNDDGIELINWWLYEKDPDDYITDCNGNHIPCETIEELWENVKEYLK